MGLDVPRLRAGLPFEGAGPLSVELAHRGLPLAFSLTSFAVPVAAVRLANEMQRVAGDALQRLPLAIDGLPGFEALNVLQVVDCVDERRSEFVKWTEKDHRAHLAGQYRMVTKLRVVESLIPSGVHACRVKDWLIAIIVSEQLKTAMESIGCRGATFSDVG